MISSIRDDTWQNLQLNAGVLLRGVDFSGVKTAEALREAIADAMLDEGCVIGATKDGGRFTCRPMLRSTEAGARRTSSCCAVVNDGWEVRMTGTVIEITPGSMQAALGLAQTERDGAQAVILLKDQATAEDFLPKLCWVGDTSRGCMMIEMRGVMNMSGVSLQMHEYGTGEMAFELQAHAASDADGAPCRIVFLEEDDG